MPTILGTSTANQILPGLVSAGVTGGLPGDGDDPRLAAQFSAVRYGAPAYAQLSRRCAPQIRGGADDEAELGVFHDLFEPHREGNLRARLDEYLRLGLRVGVTFVT